MEPRLSIMIREFHSIYGIPDNKKCTPNDVHKKGRAHPLEQVSAMDYRRP